MKPVDEHFLRREMQALWKDAGVSLSAVEAQAVPKKVVATGLAVSDGKTLPPQPTLEALREYLGDCRRCKLCETRQRIVFGDGDPKARLMFVGEGPGADEDAQGLPFVGRAGQLLTKIIEAMGRKRRDVYIANVVKCRPPGNRQPEPDEASACGKFLREQIRLVRPTVLVALGATAANALLREPQPMSRIRGRFHPLAWDESIAVMPTYHPAYLLRNPSAKKLVWDDMKIVMKALADAAPSA